MSFHEENIPAFLENFDSIKEKIRSAEGNRFLELYQDKNNPCIFFTYSYWETEQDLENYRQSELFNTVWNFTNLSTNNVMSACSISNNTFPGLISTNSMIMSPNPPVFKDSEFSYQVAGMHFEPDGKTLSVGNYTMIVSKDVVSCLYGSDQIPISASISIVNSETGDKKISVATIKNDGKFYTLNISGFNFSNPEIRVKLQFPEVKMEIIKKSITCIKGKMKKKISGINPKCPTGYRINK